MKKFFCLVSAALLLAACSEKPGYQITGTVSNPELNGQYVYIIPYGIQGDVIDSALIKNGEFTLKGVKDIAQLCALGIKSEKMAPAGQSPAFTTTFILENGKMSAILDSFSAVTGTPENNTYSAVLKNIAETRASLQQYVEEMKSEQKEVAEAAEKKLDEIDLQVTQIAKNYISSNTDKLSGSKLFFDFRYQLNEDERRDILNKANETFKSFPGIDKMEQHLVTLDKVAIGKKFTDFEMADTKGATHKLSEYVGNGKVVLIDFWASWCPPCRRDMPHLVELYKQYKNKNFEIVGISLDSKQDAWGKGIKDFAITWPQLSDLKGWQNSGAALYGVNSIPHTVLVDGKGIIIAKNIRGKALDLKLEEVLK